MVDNIQTVVIMVLAAAVFNNAKSIGHLSRAVAAINSSIADALVILCILKDALKTFLQYKETTEVLDGKEEAQNDPTTLRN